MKIKLMDYTNKPVEVEVGELDTIKTICLTVLSGDEMIEVTYKDGKTKTFDSSDDRITDYYDNSYTIYDVDDGTNLLNDDRWLNRKDSYDYYF